MTDGNQDPASLDITRLDPVTAAGQPSPPSDDRAKAEMLEACTMRESASSDTLRLPDADPTVGAFTTTLAATATKGINVVIPEGFFSAGTPGSLLRFAPVEQLRGRQPLELYLKTGRYFSVGRSPDADWIACFFPRSEKNDLRSKRLSKIHARIELRNGQLWLHRVDGAVIHLGQREVANDPAGVSLREWDQMVLAEDYALEVYYDISLKGSLQFVNGELWQGGQIEFSPMVLGAVRFEPLNSSPALRNSCWLFVDVGFGSARGGVFTAGLELAPQQGVILTIGGCFWILNLVNNGKVAINDYRLGPQEIVPLTQGDSVWLGAARYQVTIA